MEKADLKQFFKDRPAISPRQFFMEAGYSQGKYPTDYLSSENEKPVPSGIMNRIKPLLIKYGYSV